MKHATGTILTRILITLMGLLTTMIAGHRLGAGGLGDMSLILLGITALMLIANIVGGGALVYFTPRVQRAALLAPAYAWAAVTVFVGWAILQFAPLVPERFESGVIILTALQAVYTIHLNMLLGQQRIGAYNGIMVLQAAALLIAFALVTGDREIRSAQDYVLASVIAFALTLLLSTIVLFGSKPPVWKKAPPKTDGRGIVRDLFRQGGYTQGANALQLLNYRLGYWLIERALGGAPLGVYSVATQMAEGSWIAPRGLGTVLHSRLSNINEAGRQRELTLITLKTAVVLAIGVLAFVLMLPDTLIRSLFGDDVHGLRPIIALLAPGILAMAASQALSHFFSGTARNRHNTIGSGLGFLVTLVGGPLLIDRYGLRGAAGTASLAYVVNVLYQARAFFLHTGARPSDILPHAGDLDRLRALWRSVMRS